MRLFRRASSLVVTSILLVMVIALFPVLIQAENSPPEIAFEIEFPSEILISDNYTSRSTTITFPVSR